MNSIQSILVVCILIFAACDAKILPSRQELQARDSPPPCYNCSLSNTQLQELTEAQNLTGPALESIAIRLGDVLKKNFTDTKDLKAAIQKEIQSIRDSIGPVLEKMHEAVKNIETCPAVKDLYSNLKVSFKVILDILDKDWIPLINATDLASTLDQLSIALRNAVPNMSKLLKILLYNFLEVFRECDYLGRPLWNGMPFPDFTPGGRSALCFLSNLFIGLSSLLALVLQPDSYRTLPAACIIFHILGTDILGPILTNGFMRFPSSICLVSKCLVKI